MSFERLTRMISFRVTESEFEALRVKSESHGSRSISDYARIALRESPATGDPVIQADLDRLSLDVRRLSVDVRRLTELIESPRPVPRRNGGLTLQSSDTA
jgi:hypothetical protein